MAPLPRIIAEARACAPALSIRNSNEWQWFPIDEIKPYEGHARTHSKRQINKLKHLIRHFGQICPVIVDSDGVLVDGRAVWKAMRELGSGEIAAVVVANRTGPEIKALRLTLNRIPMDAAWDNDRLRVELEQLVNLSFDLELTGFDAVETPLRMPPRRAVVAGTDSRGQPLTPAPSAQPAVQCRGGVMFRGPVW